MLENFTNEIIDIPTACRTEKAQTLTAIHSTSLYKKKNENTGRDG